MVPKVAVTRTVLRPPFSATDVCTSFVPVSASTVSVRVVTAASSLVSVMVVPVTVTPASVPSIEMVSSASW
ncbi:MAG: hypothetical protein OXL95_04295, partial [Nitrospira sp.]|nr:hypothetical protein [Nitrospira sp.]